MTDRIVHNLTYRTSGVDIDAGEKAVDLIKDVARSTYTPGVMTGIGGFGAMYSLKELGLNDPVLVSGTDGVGTKLKIAFQLDRHDTIGIDAVAMCANDVLCSGAQPIYFLDYLATGKLEPRKAADIITGIAEGCKQAGCALIGGEMAEMPGFYADGEYDIAGFCVGAVERANIIDGSRIEEGDAILSIPSSGLHSNGFSLIRKIIDIAGINLSLEIPGLGGKLGDALLAPTRVYAFEVRALMKVFDVRGLAHITGGGLEGNISRIIPKGLAAEIDWTAWKRPEIFNYVQNTGNVAESEMRKVFNLGVGMAVVLPQGDAIKVIENAGFEIVQIGKIVKAE